MRDYFFRAMLFALLSVSVSYSQYFTLSDDNLDFGNVLVGGSYTLDLGIFSQAEQDFVLDIPSYFTVSEGEFSMTTGEQKVIQVTFTPPFAIEGISAPLIIQSNLSSAVVYLTASGINELSGSVSGYLSSEFSPYDVVGPLLIEEGNSLIIEAGTDIVFQGDYPLIVYGQLIANGGPNELIKFKASEAAETWSGIFAEDGVLDLSYVYVVDVKDNADSNLWTSDDHDYADFFNLSSNTEYYDIYEDFNDCELDQSLTYDGNGDYMWNCNSDDYMIPTSDGSCHAYTTLYAEVVCNDDCNISYDINFNGNSNGRVCAWISEYNHILGTFGGYIDLFDQDCYHADEYNDQTFEKDIPEDYKNKKIKIIVELRRCNNDWVSMDNFGITGLVRNNDGPDANSAIYAENSDVDISNSMFYNNLGESITLVDTPSQLRHLTLESTGQISAQGSGFGNTVTVWNSILYQVGTSGTFDYNNYTDVPFYLDEYGHLDPQISQAVDYGDVTLGEDNCMGPGLGTSIPDAGMYGGAENCGYGTDSNMPDGAPLISNVGDIPLDQGGFVGIQYEASVFDYEHPAYEIEQYSFWRELDLEGRESIDFSDSPTAEYWDRDREYWEYIGSMGALQFEQYGYTAPTIADSNLDGEFNSTFIVVAHTPDESIYFTSDPATGQSWDNLSPEAPTMISGDFDDGEISLVWSNFVDEDFDHFNIYRDNIFYATTLDSEYVDIDVPSVAEIGYTISSVDYNGNESDSSDEILVEAHMMGDMNNDFTLNVLDIVQVMEYILGIYEPEYIAYADLNEDAVVDILDIVILVNIILSENGGF